MSKNLKNSSKNSKYFKFMSKTLRSALVTNILTLQLKDKKNCFWLHNSHKSLFSNFPGTHWHFWGFTGKFISQTRQLLTFQYLFSGCKYTKDSFSTIENCIKGVWNFGLRKFSFAERFSYFDTLFWNSISKTMYSSRQPVGSCGIQVF